MSLRRVAIACIAPVALGVMAFPAQAQMPPHSVSMEKAILGEMNPATRGAVQKRATGGNTVSGVIATTLLNSYHHGKPGAKAVSVFAIDFVRGTAVVKDGDAYVPVHFDPKTLHVAG